MTTHFVKFVIDPDGDNYSVPANRLMNATVVRKVSSPTTFSFTVHNPAAAENSNYEVDDPIDIYIGTANPPTTKVATGYITEIEIERERYGRTRLTCRGEDYLTVLAYRLARAGFPGAVDISTTLTNLLTEFAPGEYTTTNVDAAGVNVTDWTSGTRKSLLSIMRELAELPSGDSFDFYLDADNDLYWHKRFSTAYDSGETLDEDDIRHFTSRRSTRDRKTLIHIQGAHHPTEETASTHNTVTDSVTLETNHYADDFIAEHDNLMKIELYIQKVGTPGADFTGRVSLAKHDGPAGDFKTFTIREEDVSATAGWHSIPIGMNTQVGTRYFVKLDKVGADSSNTYKWYGDTPAVLDTLHKAKLSTDALKWTESDYDFSMRLYYGEYTEVSSGGRGLVLWLPFDEGAGTIAYDKSPNSNDGTITGPSWTAGKWGKALDFDGSNDYVEVANSDSTQTFTAISAACWFKADTMGDSSYYRHIIDKGWATEDAWILYTAKDDKKLWWGFRLDGAYKLVRSNIELTEGQWYHAVGTYNGATVKLYINGAVQTETTDYARDSFTNTSVLRIGQSSNDHDGIIDDVRIYDRALSATEISDLYEATKSPKKEAVVVLSRAIDDTMAQALADRLLAQYLATNWQATINTEAPLSQLKPGDLITLDETGDGLASKTYRMERISWEFAGEGCRTETVELDISSVLPYENIDEMVSRIAEELMGGTGSQLQSGDAEGAAPDRIGRSVIGRSLVGYDPS